jgi:hypothetical protein
MAGFHVFLTQQSCVFTATWTAASRALARMDAPNLKQKARLQRHSVRCRVAGSSHSGSITLAPSPAAGEFMAAFFLPFADSPEQAEREYAKFPAPPQYPPVHPTARLFSIHFRQDGFDCIATVGEEIQGWPGSTGPVLALKESTQLILVYTELRGGRGGGPILVGRHAVTASEYFDDYPAN